MLAYVFLKPLDFENQFSNALHTDLPEELVKFSAPLEQAFVDLKNWATNEGAGRALSVFGGQISMEMPMDKISDLTTFLKRFEYTAKVRFAVGVGVTTSEAYAAMCQSEGEGAVRVVLYNESLEEPSQLVKAEEEADMHPDLTANLGLNDEPEGDDAAPKMDPQGKGDPKVKKEEQSAKIKIIETLQMLKEHAPTIAQLKELNPKAFEAVKRVVDAMIQMAQKDLAKGDGELAKVDPIGKIKDGKIKVQERDLATRKITGAHTHQVLAGMALSPSGHPNSAHEPNKD